MLDSLKKIITSKDEPKKMKPLHYFIILFCLGAAVMILTDFLDMTPDVAQEQEGNYNMSQPPEQEGNSTPAFSFNSTSPNDLIREYENHYETQLKEILEMVPGVTSVDVLVNLDSTPEVVVEKNTDQRLASTNETDKDKATRTQIDQSKNEQVVLINGSKNEQPVVIKTVKPKVRGVLVVAKGAENIQVKAWITEAVQKALEVPAYKISILPKK
ncbi:stage III sporulation protein AG [Brevibacillus daliensis]|uniref:stage III sporulation protein AG n=1 Tax=Brevibacillus daliensis TaxID=2892995 RepID=UPI001E5DD96B|nr:stage III sporulation protein AG [Brevibacillus daliensis]